MKKTQPINITEVEHVWSLLCSSSSVDDKSQNISIFNVLEQLNVSSEDVKKISKKETVVWNSPFQLITLLRIIGNKPFQGDVKIEVFDAIDNTVLKGEIPVAISQKEKDRLRIINNFPGLPIKNLGYYEFLISIRIKGGEYEVIGKVPFHVKAQN